MSWHEPSDENEPFLFTDLEKDSLRDAFVATATTDWHEIKLARIGFKVELLRYEHGRSGYREAELSAFSLDHDIRTPVTQLVTRDELGRDWIVLPDYCRAASLYFWERATRETTKAQPDRKRRTGWFARRVSDQSSEIVDPFQACQHRGAIQREVVYALGHRIRSMRDQLEQVDEFSRQHD